MDKPNTKKYEKKLREIELLKRKQHHTKEELEKMQRESFYKEQMFEKTKKKFEDIPEDMIFIILSYLPLCERLNILKHKYPTSVLKKSLSMLPITVETFYKLYPCVTMARKVLSAILPPDGTIMNDFRLGFYLIDKKYVDRSGRVGGVIKENNPSLLADVQFCIKVIIKTIQKYTKMYDYNSHTGLELSLLEKSMLHLFIRILAYTGFVC